MPDWLDTLSRLAGEATPGPWDVSEIAGDTGTVYQRSSGGAVAWVNEANETGDHHPYADASHIAACSPERILALAGVVAAAEEIAAGGCEASAWAGEPAPGWDRCLDPNFVEGTPEGRCAPCTAHAALAALEATP